MVVNHERMKMVAIRPLPENYQRFAGKFLMCREFKRNGFCGNPHPFAHSQEELDSWNLKKTIANGMILCSDDYCSHLLIYHCTVA